MVLLRNIAALAALIFSVLTVPAMASEHETAPAVDGSTEPESAAVRFASVIAAAEALPAAIARAEAHDILGATPPWTKTGIELTAGDRFTVLADGAIVLNADPMVSLGPTQSLWFRVGETGEIFKGTAATSTHTARTGGHLYVTVGPIGWTTRQGNYMGEGGEFQGPGGGFRVAILAWKTEPEKGLAALADAAPDEPLVAQEMTRLANFIPTPQGWHPLWRVGDSEVYRDMDFDGRSGIRAEARAQASIIRKPLDLAFTDQTRIEWSWRMHELPSGVAEDTFFTHDYMSIAVEFDNGQDITYYWSAALPEGHGYTCPLPWWDKHETHVVVRSGTEGLGEWHEQSQTIMPDYLKFVGDAPRRIVAVWLISNAVFSGSTGMTDYADVYVVEGDKRIKVL